MHRDPLAPELNDRHDSGIRLNVFGERVSGKSELDPSTQQFLSLLRDSLSEAQMTVRAYDTKAQICGIGYIFALGIIAGFEALFPQTSNVDAVYVLVAWGVVILPIMLFGFVLYPSRKKAPGVINESTAEPKHILYVDPKKYGSVAELKDAVDGCDPINETVFELLKVSNLRELKRRRFLRALFAAGICFVVLFTSQLTRTL